MHRTSRQLRSDAFRIWQAGVDAVKPHKLIPDQVILEGSTLRVGDTDIDLQAVRRIGIVGAGKAAGGMTIALERVLGEQLLKDKQVGGFVIVPEDCLVPTCSVQLRSGRPAGRG
ncbi:MAG: DUF4147 domain-containing protein [Gammaproteobacteria bacterium]|nr:DUF4147 domain-containing protein [Gammaproteobacteria bacterium]